MVGGTGKHTSHSKEVAGSNPLRARAICMHSGFLQTFIKWVKSCCYISYMSFQNCF